MNTINQLNERLSTGAASTEEMLSIFDELDPVNLEFMMSRWKGAEIQTNHPLNGLLDMTRWYGKEFVSNDHVHPLLFADSNNKIFKVAPNPLAMKSALRFPILKSRTLIPIFSVLTLLSKTKTSQARVRMMEYRQKVSATMIYDNLPIHDTFRKIDDDTVLGLMDCKYVSNPFFFILKRDR